MVRATRARTNTASSMNLLGLFEDARALLDRALTDARDRRMRILEASALHNLGMSEARLGLVDRGLEMQREAGRIADETGAARLRVNARLYEALLLLWRYAVARAEGRASPDASDLQAAQALAAFVQAEARALPALATSAKFITAAVAYSRGQLQDARDSAQSAVDALATVPMEEWEELLYLTLVETQLAMGDGAAADRALEGAFNCVCDRARRIARPEHRNAYLDRTPEVRRIVELAKTRLNKTLPFFNAILLKPPPKPGLP
jgi:hypothetical protein